ncbi:MAG: hypothetical protein MUF34_30840, partial [Polyangiaceae bacterium]|nr:hypothetical protein [Polyangiaceae bacterium]
MTYVTRPPLSIRNAGLRTCGLLCLAAALVACGDDDDGSDGAGGTGGAGGQGGEGGAFTIEQPNRFRVRLDDDAAPAVVLELDKAKALEVFGEGGAKKITILEVETEKLLRNAIAQIQNACGTDWALDQANPKHDCSKTDLGKTFGATPAEWRVSPEFALVRLLTMTPANANVTGTSLADFKELIDGNPDTFKFDFAQVLADSMGIARTAPFVPTDQLIEALQVQLFAGHPAVSDPTGKTMSVSLYDALNDLTPLATKLGPVGSAPWAAPGEHPGMLVPDDASFTTKSDVMLPTFKMKVVSDSGLRRVAGINLAKGGGDMYLRDGDAPLRFDFNDPAKLQISGLAPAGTIDMRFAMRELGSAVDSCTDEPGCPGLPTCPAVPSCKTNLPPPAGTPLPGTVWSLAPFL